MSDFQITPLLADGAPVASREFPQFLQIRLNGVNLGGPDVTTLDFVGYFTVVRGTGADANKVTITATTE